MAEPKTEPKADFKWMFVRRGGLDQVKFRSGDDIRRLGELDPKLWVALSCPAKNLEFDQRTLTLVDADRDGRIRIPEIIKAAGWLCERLKDPGVVINPKDSMPLDVINSSTDVGRRLADTGAAILAGLGKDASSGLTQADVTDAALHASEQTFNGDGVLPPLAGLDEEIRAFITDAMAVSGGVEDSSGELGINRDIAESFVKALQQWREWNRKVDSAETPLGENTPECWQLLTALKPKIDDYFLRCELVAYSPSAQDALNEEDKPLTNASGLVEHAALSELPLSKAGPDRPLDLTSGLNPAWRKRAERFAVLAKPLLRDSDRLSRKDWKAVQEALAPYDRATRDKPATAPAASATVPPSGKIDLLGEERVNRILDGVLLNRFLELADKDANSPAASSDVADMERLVLYYLHFHRLLSNFVNFDEFYTPGKSAAFQSGHLYIDGRSCDLCMPAADVEAHAAQAAGSQLFLLYCSCTRKRRTGDGEEGKKMNIVAAVTAGDSDLLTVNRNGVYVDSTGADWDATVVKTVSNPIGILQAVWSPYKRIGTLVTDQISKYASEKQSRLLDSAGKKLDEVGTQVSAGTAPKFDIGRNVGIFAAVGLALGAIGTAVGSIFNALLAMAWWQLPLLLLALLIIISGPSVLLAWLKLRKRTLGPLLEASG